jgi:hypothetical protein
MCLAGHSWIDNQSCLFYFSFDHSTCMSTSQFLTKWRELLCLVGVNLHLHPRRLSVHKLLFFDKENILISWKYHIQPPLQQRSVLRTIQIHIGKKILKRKVHLVATDQTPQLEIHLLHKWHLKEGNSAQAQSTNHWHNSSGKLDWCVDQISFIIKYM